MGSYRLASHAFVRVLEGHAFVLDLRGDGYMGFRDCAALHRDVDGWPRDASVLGGPGLEEEASVLQGLLQEGLLTPDAGSGASNVQPTMLAPPKADWSSEWLDPDAKVSVADVGRFVLAYLQTRAWWRLTFEQRVHALRACLPTGRRQDVEAEGEAVRLLTGIFLRLRPWFYTAEEQCLFDSFVLINFMRRCGHFPFLVIGVAARPFKAHAWAQFGEIALNELDARARRYAPIFVA
jgi:hypothetical protein